MEVSVRDALKGPFKYLNDTVSVPFSILQFVKSLPYVIFLQPEKGTPFGRSLPVQSIIASSPRD